MAMDAILDLAALSLAANIERLDMRRPIIPNCYVLKFWQTWFYLDGEGLGEFAPPNRLNFRLTRS